jgi:hypothetical protein
MRHIPEEELHAYLDQALSRAQAVEIESHLAVCGRCQGERDAIAGLRDRTTALLSALAPQSRIERPSWSDLRRRHVAAQQRRASVLRGAVWAASLVGAIGVGYGAHWWLDRAEAARLTALPAPDAPSVTPDAAPVTALAATDPAPAAPRARSTAARPIERLEFDTLSSTPSGPAGGVWRTASLDSAVAAGLTVPRVAGLPVIQIQVQDASSGNSNSLVAVEQQLTGGEMVRTIEGPAADIAELDRNTVASNSTTAPGSNTVSMRSGNRMLLMTARIPADSLRALLARLRTK